MTEALLQFLGIYRGATIWEPACGTGSMTTVIKRHGYNVIETDIVNGVDFLQCEPIKCDWIITNPPFSLAEDFIKRASSIGVPFAFLLKSQYWHAARRLNTFSETKPSFVLPLTWRPDFTGQGNSLLDMCWCVWMTSREDAPCIYRPLEKPKGGIQNGIV